MRSAVDDTQIYVETTEQPVLIIPAPKGLHADIGYSGGRTIPFLDRMVIQGRGNDIWGTADEFHYAYRPIVGDFSFTVKVESISPTDPWAKAGIMLRGDTSPGSPFVMMVITPGSGVAFQYRTSPSTPAAPSSSGSGTHRPPIYLRLARAGAHIKGSWSTDGINFVERDSVQVSDLHLLGLAVTSHNRQKTASATFTEMHVFAPGLEGVALLREVPADQTSIEIPVEMRDGRCFFVTTVDAQGRESEPSEKVCPPRLL